MKPLSKHISNLLFEHDCVIVPGLGGFITNYKPAHIHPVHHTFYPPSKQVTFNAGLNINDGTLAQGISRSLNIDYSEATRLIEQEVHSIKISMLKGQKVVLDQVGSLYTNKENSIQFVPSNDVNYLGEAYGLPRFTSHAIIRSSQVSLNKPVVRKTMKWAAIMVPLATVALWSSMNMGALNQLYNNTASIIPSYSEIMAVTPAAKPSSKTAVASSALIARPAVESVEVVVAPVKDSFFIIAGAFSVPENAMKLVNQLKAEGYNASVVGENGRKLHLVSIESFNNLDMASAKMSQLHQKGFPSAWLLSKAL